MAVQTESEVQAEISTRIAVLHELAKFCGLNSSGTVLNYITREQTALATVQGDYSRQANQEMAALRLQIAQAVEGAMGRRILDPCLRNYAKVMTDVPEQAGLGILVRLYLRFIANNLRVKSRNISFGSISAGSNFGSGTINRLTADAYGFNIEACHMETKKAYCVLDQDTGAEKHKEVFLVRSRTRNIDQLIISGSGLLAELVALAAVDSLITNASFSQYGGDLTSLTELSGWTASSLGNFNLDDTNYYRSAGGLSDPTPLALKFLGNGNVSQLFSVNNIQLNPDIPIYVQLAYNRSVGSCDGTLTLQCGVDSVSVNVGSAGAGWNILRLPLTKMRYPRNFAAMDNPLVKITLAGRTSGTLLVDDVIMQPFTQIDGTWYALVGGATPFEAGNRDSFSWVDALVGADSIIQQWLWRCFGAYLPHVSDGSQTWAEPSV